MWSVFEVGRRAPTVVALVGLVLTLPACSSDEESPPESPLRVASSEEAASAVDRLISTGLEQIAAGEEDEARATFATVLELDPDNPYAAYNLGYLAQAAGDEAEAARQYSDLLATAPDFAPAIYNLAILTEPRDLPAAVALYRRVLRQNPEDAAAHMRLGFALEHLGQQAEGGRHLAAAVRLDPSLADVKAPRYG